MLFYCWIECLLLCEKLARLTNNTVFEFLFLAKAMN
jgi:hypothetical protein